MRKRPKLYTVVKISLHLLADSGFNLLINKLKNVIPIRQKNRKIEIEH